MMMTLYIALLRGINVGGKNKIKMADLKTALEGIGLERVQTYIQSGNVLFFSMDSEAALRSKLEKLIEEVFNIKLTVVLRTDIELESIVAGCPFSAEAVANAEASSDSESLYVAMLPEPPAAAGIAKLAAANNENDLYEIVGPDVYLLFQNSVRNAKLATNIQKLGVPATVRNWNTMNKLVELARAMRD